MKNALLLIIGAAGGFLLALVLHLPWLRPLDSNVTNVAAAISSSVLAVAGAYFLWRHQLSQRQDTLTPIAVSMFQPLYLAVRQIALLGEFDSAKKMLAVATNTPLPEIPDAGVWKYQLERMPKAIDAALLDARVARGHWNGFQEILLGVKPAQLPSLMELHRLTEAAMDRLPPLRDQAKQIYLEYHAPRLDELDWKLFRWGVGRMAKMLNELDGGHRDTSDHDAIAGTREAMIDLITEHKKA